MRTIWTTLALLSLAAAIVFWSFNGLILERHGRSYWAPVSEHTFWLPRPIRLALHRPPPTDRAGTMRWHTIAPGFETAELPVLVGEIEVDRIFLARIDSSHFRFEVENETANPLTLDGWMRRTGAVLVVNGPYFERDATPAIPAVIAGAPVGPIEYVAEHGAFISSTNSTTIADLAQQDWRAAFDGARTAFVSYPLLIAPDGETRTATDAGWLANRSFIAQEPSGLIIIGTTKSGFFTLPRLADFLRRSPLNLRIALNLDGGKVACQGIALGGYRRTSYGQWEARTNANGHARLLPGSLPILNALPETMPLVLTVYPRDEALQRAPSTRY